MVPLPPSLLALLALLALLWAAPPAATEMSQSVWHRALVSQSQLKAAATSESFQVSDEILCAILASKAPWCHLMTYESTNCVLYDVVVDSMDAATNAITPCWTRHRNVCIVEGAPLPHGAKLVQDCQPRLCWNRAIIPDYTESTCDGDFQQMDFGCVYLHREAMTWWDARHHCATLCADLAIASASEYEAMRVYLYHSAGLASVWIGAKSRKWLDGREVTRNEWHLTDPNGDPDDCVHTYNINGFYSLADGACSYELIFLCKRPV